MDYELTGRRQIWKPSENTIRISEYTFNKSKQIVFCYSQYSMSQIQCSYWHFISGYICSGNPSLERWYLNFSGGSNLKSITDSRNERRIQWLQCLGTGRQKLSSPGPSSKLTLYMDSPYTTPHTTHSLVPTCTLGRNHRIKQYTGLDRGCFRSLRRNIFSKHIYVWWSILRVTGW